MLTAKEKAGQWLQDNWGGPWSDEKAKSLEALLKQQDHDTRHACAEAVGGSAAAHNACMNVQAV